MTSASVSRATPAENPAHVDALDRCRRLLDELNRHPQPRGMHARISIMIRRIHAVRDTECQHLHLANMRAWPGESFSVGECTSCGSTVQAKEADSEFVSLEGAPR